MAPRVWLLWAALLTPGLVAAEEAVRRELVDAGVHQPVLTRAPELLQFVEARYPEEAARAGKTASVRMRVTVGAEGAVTDAQVADSVGDGFDEAALEAVRAFTFRPAEVDGKPAAVQIEYVYHFTLAAPPPPAEPPPPKEALLRGTIRARGSRTLVNTAVVRCGDDPEAPEAITDVKGRFELRTPPGVCAVRVLAAGYDAFSSSVTLAPGETVEVAYSLEQKATGFEIVVKGQRDSKEVVRRTLQREEMQKVPGTFGDPVRVIQNLPGVARAPFVAGQLIVRGANPAQTATFMDGVEIPILFHLLGGPSVVNAEFLDRVDFFPGGFGGRYGRAVGGVVDVTTRKGAQDTVHGVVKIDLLDTGVYVTTPIIDGISVSAAARRSYVDALLPLFLPDDPAGGSLLVLPRYWDYQVRLDIGKPPTDLLKGGHTFSVFAFGSDDSLQVIASGGARTRDVSLDIHTLFHRLKGDWTYRKGNFTSTFAPYLGYDLNNFIFGASNLFLDVYTAGGREDLTLRLNDHITLRGGLDVLYEHLVGRANAPVLSGTQFVPFPGGTPRAETQELREILNGFDGALYAETDLRWGPVTLTPGLRATWIRAEGQGMYALDPRLWAKVEVTPRAVVKASVGLYSQRPETTDLIRAPFGNPNLGPERSFQTSLGALYRFTDAINLDVTGFYNRRFNNIVAPGRTFQNPDGSITQEALSNAGLGRAYGLEVLLRHEVTAQFFGWIAYTLSRSEVRRAGEEDSPYVLGAFDQTHILSVVASYKLPWGFELGGRFRYVTGRPITPVIHPYDIYSADSNSYSATTGPTASSRIRPFQQLDLRLEKLFVFKSWTLSAYVDVQNVYNYQNTEARFFDYRFRREYQVPGIPILPVVGVKGAF